MVTQKSSKMNYSWIKGRFSQTNCQRDSKKMPFHSAISKYKRQMNAKKIVDMTLTKSLPRTTRRVAKRIIRLT